MGESDWGKRLANKTSNSENKKKPKFGVQVINEGANPYNDGITRYEISEKDNKKK